MKRKEQFFEPSKIDLDHIVLDIEFLLISIIQGAALVTLAEASVVPLKIFDLSTYPYIISGFMLILIFWSQAILHSFSIIEWPMDVTHTFLYFLACFFEIMAFSHLEDPFQWFLQLGFFFIIAGILYMVDYRLIKSQKNRFSKDSKTKTLFSHIVARQKIELKTLIPLGLLFNFGAAYLIFSHKELFIDKGDHLFLIGLQFIFTLGVLITSMKNFKKRSQLISQTIIS